MVIFHIGMLLQVLIKDEKFSKKFKGKLLSRIKEEDNQILAIDYSSQGQFFATAGKDRTVRLI